MLAGGLSQAIGAGVVLVFNASDLTGTFAAMGAPMSDGSTLTGTLAALGVMLPEGSPLAGTLVALSVDSSAGGSPPEGPGAMALWLTRTEAVAGATGAAPGGGDIVGGAGAAAGALQGCCDGAAELLSSISSSDSPGVTGCARCAGSSVG